jgi:DNA-binding NarL/FixJ family response regulator
MAHEVFISYASQDKATADAACRELEENGIRCWIAPRDVIPGQSWATAIAEAIERARAVVLIFSRQANASNQIPNEVTLAVDNGLVLIPFRIDPIEPTGDLQYFLEAQHWLDAFDPPFEKHFEKLLNAVKANLPETQPETTVAIVDDHPLYRQGLAMAIEGAADLEVAGEAKSIEEFDKLKLKVDVVLLDLHLPGIEGSAGVAYMCERGNRVLVVSAAGSPDDVLDAIAAGASGYLTKETDAEEITRAVRVVAGGESYVSPTLASYLLRAQRSTAAITLTKREREVLELLAVGETDQDIADRLYIARATVHSHLEHIRNKTGARRRVELTHFANRIGIGPDRRDKPR